MLHRKALAFVARAQHLQAFVLPEALQNRPSIDFFLGKNGQKQMHRTKAFEADFSEKGIVYLLTVLGNGRFRQGQAAGFVVLAFLLLAQSHITYIFCSKG